MKLRVTIDIFSGRPNPVIEIEDAAATKIMDLLSNASKMKKITNKTVQAPGSLHRFIRDFFHFGCIAQQVHDLGSCRILDFNDRIRPATENVNRYAKFHNRRFKVINKGR